MAISRFFLLHQSYTRIGFTDYQEIVFRQYAQTFPDVLEACRRTDRYPASARFRWTCDATGPLEYWLATASDEEVRAWAKRTQEGRIEVTALPYHLTPLPPQEALVRYLYALRRLADVGITSSSAMSLGVNGVSAGLIDPLTQSGIRYLFVAADNVRRRSTMPTPSAFWWEAPSGARLLVWNGLPVDAGRAFGIGGDFEATRSGLAKLVQQLDEQEYPFDFLVLQTTGGKPGINAGADPKLSDWVRDWNKARNEKDPAIELALPQDVFRHLEATHGDDLPIRRGEWPDWWADGVGSSAYETAVQRETHALTLDAERLATCAQATDPSATYPAEELREAFWHLALYDEHTWGSENSVTEPFGFPSQAQWNAKAGFAYRAAYLSRDTLTRACDRLRAQLVAKEDGIVVFNPLPWPRDAFVHWPQRGLDTSLGLSDVTSGEPTPKWVTDQGISFVASGLPSLGYKLYRWTDTASFPESVLTTEGTTLENRYYRIVVDETTGLIRSWYDRELDRELMEERNPYGLGQVIYERIDTDHGRLAMYEPSASGPREPGRTKTNAPFVRISSTAARMRSGRQSPLAASIVSEFLLDGFHHITQEVILYEHHRWVDLEITVHKLPVRAPESAYIVFPFFVPGCVARIETSGGIVRVEDDLMEGTCRDWLALQTWADFSNDSFGITIATPDAPLAQFGRINTGRWQTAFSPRSASLFSWILNNYWHTNFRPEQHGQLRFRYRIASHARGFDPVAATRFGQEATHRPIVRAVTPNSSGALTEESGSFLQVEPDTVVVTGLKRAEDGNGYIVRLREIAGRDTVARVRGMSATRATATTPLESDTGPVPIWKGEVIRYVPAHGLVTLRLLP